MYCLLCIPLHPFWESLWANSGVIRSQESQWRFCEAFPTIQRWICGSTGIPSSSAWGTPWYSPLQCGINSLTFSVELPSSIITIYYYPASIRNIIHCFSGETTASPTTARTRGVRLVPIRSIMMLMFRDHVAWLGDVVFAGQLLGTNNSQEITGQKWETKIKTLMTEQGCLGILDDIRGNLMPLNRVRLEVQKESDHSAYKKTLTNEIHHQFLFFESLHNEDEATRNCLEELQYPKRQNTEGATACTYNEEQQQWTSNFPDTPKWRIIPTGTFLVGIPPLHYMYDKLLNHFRTK